MSFSYQLGANPQIDAPRFLAFDTQSVGHIYEDEEILMAYQIDAAVYFSAVSTNLPQSQGAPSYRRVAAVLLDALASNRARLAGIVESLDVKLSLDKAADELRKTAQGYRDTEANSGAFAIAEMYLDQFTGRQRIWKQLLRISGA